MIFVDVLSCVVKYDRDICSSRVLVSSPYLFVFMQRLYNSCHCTGGDDVTGDVEAC